MNVSLLKNYFKVSQRHLARNKTFSVVNVLGLSLGMAAALVISDYASFERSFDNFHEQADNIYRVTTSWNHDKTPDDKRATTVPWSGPGVKEAFPEVVEYTRFAPLTPMSGNATVVYKGEKIEDDNIYLADPGFFRIFSFTVIAGDKTSALNEPGNIVLTRSVAEKYFKDEDPINKVVFLNARNLTETNFRITAIVDDPPINSQVQFDFLVSYSAIPKGLENGSTYWHWDYTYCYLLLRPDANAMELEKKISDLRVEQFGKDFGVWNDQIDFKLQRLKDIHLYSSLRSESSINGDGRAIQFLLIVGGCILLSAYVNYINLSTVNALQRRKEIGVRKVIGSTRRQLIFQTAIESVSINVFAFILSVALAMAGEAFLERSIAIPWSFVDLKAPSPVFLLGVAAVLTTGVLLSTIYPAYVLTSFNPAEALKGGKTIKAGGRSPLRNMLTVFQFTFCFMFITGTFVLFQQLQFMKRHDLGMNMHQVVVVNGFGFQPYKDYLNFKHQLSSSSRIASTSYATAAPGDEVMELGLRPKVTSEGRTTAAELKFIGIDEDFFETLDIKLLAGRSFDPAIKTDGDAVVINEAAARALGYDDPVQIVGQTLKGVNESLPSRVIGVTANYHQRSLKNSLEAIVFAPAWKLDFGWNKRYYFVKISPTSGDEQISLIEQLRNAWNSTVTDHPFSYFFLEMSFEDQYKQDASVSSLFMFFSGFAIFIACLGLFGLIAYITLQRTKEIGIRKVLGASVQSILVLLSSEMARLILVAALVSVPASWFIISKWLEDYAFRIDIKPAVFIYPIGCVFALAFLTITFKTLRTATDNPVDSLRHDQ